MVEFVLTALPFEKLWTRTRIIISDHLSPACDLARLLAASTREGEREKKQKTWEAEDLNKSFRFLDCWPRCCLAETIRMSGNISLITLPFLYTIFSPLKSHIWTSFKIKFDLNVLLHTPSLPSATQINVEWVYFCGYQSKQTKVRSTILQTSILRTRKETRLS